MSAKRSYLLVLSVVVVVCAIAVIHSRVASQRRRAASMPRESITFNLAGQPSSALAFVAIDQGFFDEAGLDVSVVKHVSGKRALLAMLDGKGDVVTSAEVPVVFQSMARSDFRLLAQIGSTDRAACIVANKASGIATPADLRGKRVGTQRASAVHFYLHMFLVKYGMQEEDVSLSFMKAEKLPGALGDGSIDAMCMREPYVSQAREALGSNAIVFNEGGIYYRTEHLVASEALVNERPHVVSALLKALVRAEAFAKGFPEQLPEILARQLEISTERAAAVVGNYALGVSLDQALLVALEDEAAWVVKYGLADNPRIPNFLDLIYVDGLEAVKPGAVTIIH